MLSSAQLAVALPSGRLYELIKKVLELAYFSDWTKTPRFMKAVEAHAGLPTPVQARSATVNALASQGRALTA